MSKYFLAIDIGASSGRHILGSYENGKIALEEVYRFWNGMDDVEGTLCWDTSRLFNEIITGMKKCKEFYFNSREQMRQMTDEEYAAALANLVGERKLTAVIVDPSAASFIEVLRRKGWTVVKADNDVLSGIRLTSDALKEGKIVICEGCNDIIREMDEYVWDLGSGGKDRIQ